MFYEGKNIQLVPLNGNLLELTLNHSGSVNKFDKQTLEEFREAILVAHHLPDIKGLLLTSSKPSFLVGADVTEFIAKFSLTESELLNWIKYATDIFDSLEDLPYPSVSAISGFALGGGCETILATDFRISDNTAQIGLPEVKLGIMPGFGGTVRMSRLLGADNAMELITTGKQIKAEKALALGLVDAVVAPENLRDSAIDCLNKAANNTFNWQAIRLIKTSPLKLNQIESTMSFSLAKAMVAQQAGKHYPAPMMAVSTIEKGADCHRSDAMKIENENFVKLAKTPQAKALVGLFLADQKLKSTAKSHITETQLDKTAVLGAGIMGGGIAYQTASKHIPIVMKDINQDALDLGIKHACELLNKQISRGKIDAMGMASTLTKITPSLDYASLTDANIIVEAVVENPKIKSQVLAELESHVHSDCILTSNTSTISINLLAESLSRKDKFCGMHFFNPVHKMPLVEVIRGEYSSDETISSVVQYALKMGKSPIVVNDCPGFFVNRVLFPYLAAFNQLLIDGADFEQVDKIMEKQFGWPMGPAYLLDVIGIDTAFHAQQVMAEGFPERMPLPSVNLLEKMYQAKQLGQKSGSGFYQYVKDKKGKLQKQPSAFIKTLLEEHKITSQTFDDSSVIDRLMIPMINEVILCLDEKIIDSAEEADMGLIYGLGFPPFRGGAIRYLESVGINEYITRTQSYIELGISYQVSPSLQQKALSGSVFFTH